MTTVLTAPSDTDMTLRHAAAGDAQSIADIQNSIFGEDWLKNSFDSYIENTLHGLYCAELDGKIIGYLSANFVIGEAEITSVATIPEYRNRKTASSLMSYFEENAKARGVKEIFLEVRTQNTPAIHLYEKFGYKNIAVRKNYYKDDHAYVMKKEL